MNKKVAAAIFLILTILITLTLGSYNFYVSNASASMPIFVQEYGREGFTESNQNQLPIPTPQYEIDEEQIDGFSGIEPVRKSVTTSVKQ